MWVMATSPKNYIALFSFQNLVGGTKPMVGLKYWSWDSKREPETGVVAQLARAPALQAGCRGFEPHQLHHTTSRWREK